MSIQSDVFNTCYKYIVENSGKPYILVATQFMPTDELKPYANPDGSIVLNISMSSVQYFFANAADITFSMAFRGQVVHARIPYVAIFSIYNVNDPTIGMLVSNAFPIITNTPEPPIPPKIEPPIRKKPKLTLVKK